MIMRDICKHVVCELQRHVYKYDIIFLFIAIYYMHVQHMCERNKWLSWFDCFSMLKCCSVFLVK